MNTNQKKLKLIGHGLKPSTLENLSESQVNLLFGKLAESKKDTKESVTKTSTTTTFDPAVDADRKAAQDLMSKKGVPMSIDPATKKLTVVSEKDETVEGEVDEKFESKKQQKLFFAKCGDGKTKEQKKWCKMADEFSKDTNFAKLPEKKTETKEGYLDMVQNAHTKVMSNKIGQVQPNPKFVSELENRITKLVEKHITPKMSKKDFLSLLDEGSETAPANQKLNQQQNRELILHTNLNLVLNQLQRRKKKLVNNLLKLLRQDQRLNRVLNLKNRGRHIVQNQDLNQLQKQLKRIYQVGCLLMK